MNKNHLRKKIIKKRNSLDQKYIHKISNDIFNILYSLPIYKNASSIMSYVSINKEVFTHDFIKKSIKNGKKVYIPVTKPRTKELVLSHLIDFDNDLKKGYWGLLEPKKETFRPHCSEFLDLIIVPGLIFSQNGHRLGYGGGYYDAFLSSLTESIPTLGIAFECQVTEKLPVQSHDISVDYILTEKRFIQCEDFKK